MSEEHDERKVNIPFVTSDDSGKQQLDGGKVEGAWSVIGQFETDGKSADTIRLVDTPELG